MGCTKMIQKEVKKTIIVAVVLFVFLMVAGCFNYKQADAQPSEQDILKEIAKVEQEVSAERRKQCSLTDAQIHALVALGKKVEQHYGSPQDIEWALDQEGSILLLQSRPETVWATKERAPVAKPAARPFDHIFNLMGGLKK